MTKEMKRSIQHHKSVRPSRRSSSLSASPQSAPTAETAYSAGRDTLVSLAPTYPEDPRFEPLSCGSLQQYRVPVNRPARIYCDGVYDLFHYGHARQLLQAKNLFPNVYLLVGVTNGSLTHSRKGITVMSESERYESTRHCKYVDEVIEDAPWTITPEFMEKQRIDFVAHDDAPYAGADGSDDIYKPLKDTGRFIPTKRTRGISTSALITRLVRDYDAYLRRQILRGISKKELNISSFKETRVKLAEKLSGEMREIKSTWKENQTKLKSRLASEISGLKASIVEQGEKITSKFQTEMTELKNDFEVLARHWEALSSVWLKSFLSQFDSIGRDGWIEKLVDFVKKPRTSTDGLEEGEIDGGR